MRDNTGMTREQKLNFVKSVFSIVIICLVIGAIAYGLYTVGVETTPVWHDLGKVTAYQSHDELVWNDNQQAYVHETWTTANITTTSHGVIPVDSRGSCPWLIACSSMEVTAWHLNQTVGVVYKQGGWYEVTDP